MIGGIFETIGKTLGIGQEKYFLELDDAAEASVEKIKKSATQAVESAVETAKDVSADVVDKAQDLAGDVSGSAESTAKNAANKAKANVKAAASQTKEAADEAVGKTKAATKKAVKEAKSDAADKKPTFGKKSSKKAPLATGGAPDVEKDKSSQPAAPAAADPEELIIAAIAATADGKALDSQGNVVEKATGFADTYLMPRTGGRRRPGPSLSGFKGMAKEVNPRLKG
ncbi:MAG: hypothetical protein AAGN15_17230 [Cyanobacteria bacterium J06581_3]